MAHDAGTFDYVIAGGGTAGCALAARLSEDPDVTVCLLEAGPDRRRRRQHPGACPSGCTCWTPATTGTTRSSRRNAATRSCGTPRAKVLGGCSSHNSCIAFLPPAECLDEWVTMGATGWSAAEVLPLTRPAHRHDGVCCETCRPKTPAGQRFWRPRRRSACRPSAFNRGETVPQRRGLVPDQRRRGRHQDVQLACVSASDPGLQAQPRGAHRLLGVRDPVRRRRCAPPASATSGRI